LAFHFVDERPEETLHVFAKERKTAEEQGIHFPSFIVIVSALTMWFRFADLHHDHLQRILDAIFQDRARREKLL